MQIKIVILTPYIKVFQRVGLRLVDQLNNYFGQQFRINATNKIIELQNDKVHTYIERISYEGDYYKDNRADIIVIDPSIFKYVSLYETSDYLEKYLLSCPNDLENMTKRRIYFLGEDGRTLDEYIIY